ncbi:hypothetical protein [Deinococcus soli (ex Cha et al. 2016)]|uniref:Yip1 domain-containing protein n=2 Tax=Deinococcus soli (ex Cha et al. 2016) TaxID=1309411 RepID=A0AAE3XET1_9DEIO|nr:hypothetical protein [Deinococcus soli (ex Cha et al. 2016)]MDR6218398.1 hypothetical protein [Deinococcus soli (ex Cha et al. 2016)]MDR6329138.1 hypothetical protein [Deinococcus soli (ex Cha et al. 2016)]MDR6751411.1 hypothetical protein [Deinococcus soli (ex Cha et al. 2016)]
MPDTSSAPDAARAPSGGVPVYAIGDGEPPRPPRPALDVRPYVTFPFQPTRTAAAVLARPHPVTGVAAVACAAVVADALRMVFGRGITAEYLQTQLFVNSVTVAVVALLTHLVVRLLGGRGGWRVTALAVAWGAWVKSVLGAVAAAGLDQFGPALPPEAVSGLGYLCLQVSFLMGVWAAMVTVRAGHRLTTFRSVVAVGLPLSVLFIGAVMLMAAAFMSS